jgi:hypothetical protein
LIGKLEATSSDFFRRGTSDGLARIFKGSAGNESHAIANAYLYALHAKERNQRIKEMADLYTKRQT